MLVVQHGFLLELVWITVEDDSLAKRITQCHADKRSVKLNDWVSGEEVEVKLREVACLMVGVAVYAVLVAFAIIGPGGLSHLNQRQLGSWPVSYALSLDDCFSCNHLSCGRPGLLVGCGHHLSYQEDQGEGVAQENEVLEPCESYTALYADLCQSMQQGWRE